MLLARRQRQDKTATTVRIDGLADKTSRNAPDKFLLTSKKTESRAAETHRHAQTLSLADRNVDAEFSRRLEQAERERFRRHRDQLRACFGACSLNRRQVFDDTEKIRIADQHAHRLIVQVAGQAPRHPLHLWRRNGISSRRTSLRFLR